jgi:hypothetical protein
MLLPSLASHLVDRRRLARDAHAAGPPSSAAGQFWISVGGRSGVPLLVIAMSLSTGVEDGTVLDRSTRYCR